MTTDETQKIINRLDALLDRERAALLEGDLEKISAYLEEKEQLAGQLNPNAIGEKITLQDLQTKAERNQLLLDSALQGIRKVASRMAAFRRIRRSLETYDETGRKRTIDGVVEHQVEKRA